MIENTATNVVSFHGRKPLEQRFRFKCDACDEIHVGLPDVTFEMPDVCHSLGAARRSERMLLTPDFCILDGRLYFIRCVIEAPVPGFEQRFGWGVWCEVDWRCYKTCWERFEEPDNDGIAPFPGRLANHLRHYDDTLGLDCTITLQNDHMRPLVTIESKSHRLARHQRHGMSLDEAVAQAREIGALLIAAETVR